MVSKSWIILLTPERGLRYRWILLLMYSCGGWKIDSKRGERVERIDMLSFTR